MRVVRWNHSGDPQKNPEQHNPVELGAVPRPDPKTGGLRGGVAEDFPNGGGNRAYLFVVDGPEGRFSWFWQNSASAVDLDVPIVVDGTNYGAPIENLKIALKAAGLQSVDLWMGTGGAPIAQLVLPVLKPKAYLPIHWDGLWGSFQAGRPEVFGSDTRGAALGIDGSVYQAGAVHGQVASRSSRCPGCAECGHQTGSRLLDSRTAFHSTLSCVPAPRQTASSPAECETSN